MMSKGKNRDNTQRYSSQHICGANTIKIKLHNTIILWDNCNQQANGKTDSEQQRIMKDRQIIKFKKLISYKYKRHVHPSDLGFFPEDEEKLINKLTDQKIQDYVAIHWKTFENSKKQLKTQSVEGVQSIIVWLWSIFSNKLRIKQTEQQHQEPVLKASLT